MNVEEYEGDRHINNAEDILDGNYTTENYWVIITTENYSKTEDSQTTSSESTATGTPTTSTKAPLEWWTGRPPLIFTYYILEHARYRQEPTEEMTTSFPIL